MTNIEQQIIDLIQNNSHLSEDLKKRYILTLFLMETKEQGEYLKLMKAFSYRCGAVERGIYVVTEEEKKEVMRSVEAVKEDILNKIHSN